MSEAGMNDEILEKIYRSSLKFLEPLSLEETYKVIVNEAVRLIKGDSGAIFVMENGELQRVYSSHPAKIPIRRRGFAYKSYKNKRAFVIHAKDFKDTHPDLLKEGFKSAVFIPLFNRNKSIGVLVVRSKSNEDFTRSGLNTLKLFGAMASLAVRKTQLYTEVAKALEAKTLFVSMAAHELRTPLTSISGYIQLLYKKLGTNNGSSETRWIKDLSSESMRLTKITHDLLEANRIQSGLNTFNFQPTSLHVVIEAAIQEFKLGYPNRSILISDKVPDSKDMVIIDSNKIIQVISNLLENAVKFSDSNAEIMIDLSQRSHWIIIKIMDKGIGIPKKDIPYIFESYYRGSNKKGNEGIGIGLFLAKNIIEKHKGDIIVKSQMDKGTTFEIRLPKKTI